MKLVITAASGQWLKATSEAERIAAKATTLAMRETGDLAEKNGRAAVAAAGFTSNVQRTIRALNKPPSGYVLNPKVWLHSTVNYLDVFETGKTITGSPYLWLPLPAVPPNTGSGTKFGGLVSRPHMTPSQYIKKVGPLVFMRRPNGLPMLGAVVRRRTPRARKFGLFPTKGALKRGAISDKATETIPLFVAVASVHIPKKFDVEAAAKTAFDQFQKFYDANEDQGEI